MKDLIEWVHSKQLSTSFDTAIHPVLTLCGHLFWYQSTKKEVKGSCFANEPFLVGLAWLNG
jgi:hypothetical protein